MIEGTIYRKKYVIIIREGAVGVMMSAVLEEAGSDVSIYEQNPFISEILIHGKLKERGTTHHALFDSR
jgi:predicted flavoprotein YhiN